MYIFKGGNNSKKIFKLEIRQMELFDFLVIVVVVGGEIKTNPTNS